MGIERKESREFIFAKAYIIDKNIPGQIRDINREGFKLFVPFPVNVEKDESLSVMIIPQENQEMEQFEVIGNVRWIKEEASNTIIGFHIDKKTALSSTAFISRLTDLYTKHLDG